MGKKVFFLLVFLISVLSRAQNVIAVQSFENSGDTWTPLNFSTPPCSSNNDIWDYVTSLPGISSSEGSQFWGIRDLNGNCGGNGFETITFPNVTVSSFNNVVFSFDYNAISFDNNDDLKYELFFDNVSQGEVVVVDGVGGNSDNTNGWITETVVIPGSVSNVSLILSARNNDGNDRGGFDNVRLEEASEDSCFSAQSLEVYAYGESSGNEISANTLNTTPSDMSLTSCDIWAENYDLFYSFTVPQGQTDINIITGGTNGNTINLAVWDDCNGNVIFCSNEDSSLHEITGLTSGTSYILQVWHDFGFGSDKRGPFTIALETPQPPANNGSCTNAMSLQVYPEGTSSGNEITANTLTTTPSNLSLTSCDRWGDNYDLFYTFTAPLGTTSINVLTNGANGNTINLAVWDDCSGNEVFCSNDNNSLHEITGLTPGTSYILQVWHDFGFGSDNRGEFTIALEYSIECTETTRWNNSGWNNGPPNSYTTAIINSDYDTQTQGSFESCDCQINTNASLNIREDDYITIYNNLSVNGLLEVRHEGSLVMINDAGTVIVNGQINVHKTSAPFNQYDYTYWSSPSVNETIESALATSVPERIYRFNTSVYSETPFINGWEAVSGTTVMEPGVGYIAMGPTSGSFPQTQNVLFDGPVNNGVIETPIDLSVDSSNDLDDWNLIGNPYPSGISVDSLLNNALNSAVVGGTVYLWTHNTARNMNPGEYDYTSNDYATYTIGTGGVTAISGGERPTGIIASGQSFFIEGTNAGVITFNNAMRVETGNDQFFRETETKKSIADEDKKIWLDLKNNNGAFNQLLIGFVEGASNGIDRDFDGLKFGGSWVSFYSILENKRFAVRGDSPLDQEDRIIPLGFSSYVKDAPELTLSISNFIGDFGNYDLILNDKLLNKLHDLKISDYTFIQDQDGVFDNRFELLIKSSNSTLSNTEIENYNSDLLITQDDSVLHIRSSDRTPLNSLFIYDVLGKKVFEDKSSSTEYSLYKSIFTKGQILIINTFLYTGQSTSKKIIVN